MQSPPQQRQLKCPVCQGARITPPTSTHTAGASSTTLLYGNEGGGFFDGGVNLVLVGMACLDCGHAMLFVAPDSLAIARAQPLRPIMPK